MRNVDWECCCLPPEALARQEVAGWPVFATLQPFSRPSDLSKQFFAPVFEVMLPPFGTRQFSVPVPRQRFHEPPFARHLPARQLLEQELFQFLLHAAPAGLHAGHDEVHTVRVLAWHAKDQAIGHRLMLAQRFLDDRRQHLASRNVDVVIRAANQVDFAVPDFRNVVWSRTSGQLMRELLLPGFFPTTRRSSCPDGPFGSS